MRVKYYNYKQGNCRVDYTSPALYTPVTPFPADPIFTKLRNCCIGDQMILCAASTL